MQSDWDRELGDLEAQVASKEREWKELQAVRIQHLETSLKQAKDECSSLRKHNQQLREDFQFNLSILDERDRELQRYDVITTRALTVEHNRQEELNQVRMQVATLEERRAKDAEDRQEELSIRQQDAAEHRLQLDELSLSMAREIRKKMEEYQRMKRDLQRRIDEAEGELTQQRQEMTAAFDNDLGRQQHEFNLRMDEMRAVLLSNDVKMKLLSKDGEVHRQARLQATEALKASQELQQQLQTQLQHKDWVIKDITAVKDLRIKELEDQTKRTESKLKKEEDKHIKRYEDVVRALRECNGQLEAQCQAHTEQLQRAEQHIVQLQDDMEVLSAQARSAQKHQQKAMKQKDETIKRLRTEVETAKGGWDKSISQASSEMVAKDTELITLQERELKLRTDLERYKHELSAGLKRERALEQLGVQVELEWQRRCEDMKAEHYLANEQLIQDLTRARDQAKAELKENEKELQDLTVLLRSIKLERDKAMQGLTPKVDHLASEEIRSLQEQNSVLRAVISQMRKDMEGLSHVLPRPHSKPQASSLQPVQHPQAPAAASITPTADIQLGSAPPAKSRDISLKTSPAAPEYTQALEQEVCLLKARCRNLVEQLEGAKGLPGGTPTTDQPSADPALIVPHSQRNQGLKQGSLCLEKGDNSFTLRNQIPHVETALSNIMEQSVLVRQLQEENLCLRQQKLVSGRIAGGLFENVQDMKSNLPPVHTRLKQAASYIARLSSEKQQLIEMGNCLRAQITTAGQQEPMEPERDSSTEIHRNQHDRLSALEQLQYQLTTQELQFAVKQRACTDVEKHPGTTREGPSTRGADNPLSQEHKTTDRPESPNTKENTPPNSQSQSSLEGKLLQPHSGLSRSQLQSDESLPPLNELWEMLDHGLSPSIYSEAESELSRRGVTQPVCAGVTVYGISAPIHSRHPAVVQQSRNPSKTPSNTSKTCRPGAPVRASRIRNYNVKD